jgi:hypothetical protein
LSWFRSPVGQVDESYENVLIVTPELFVVVLEAKVVDRDVVLVTEVVTEEDVVGVELDEDIVLIDVGVMEDEVLGVDEAEELEVVTTCEVVVLLLVDNATPAAAAITMITITTTTMTALETAAILRLI